MSSSGQFFTLITLSDRVVPGFAGIIRASMMSGESLSIREIKVVIAVPHMSLRGKPLASPRKPLNTSASAGVGASSTHTSSPCRPPSYSN